MRGFIFYKININNQYKKREARNKKRSAKGVAAALAPALRPLSTRACRLLALTSTPRPLLASISLHKTASHAILGGPESTWQ